MNRTTTIALIALMCIQTPLVFSMDCLIETGLQCFGCFQKQFDDASKPEDNLDETVNDAFDLAKKVNTLKTAHQQVKPAAPANTQE